MDEIYRPGVALQPNVYHRMHRGFNQILNAVRPTLGPFPRAVAYDHGIGKRPPELLDDGGIIVRRIIQLTHRTEDVGAMFLRQVLWHVRERAGDGTATTAVLFEAVFNHSLRYLAAGGNAMELRRHLEAGMQLIDNELAGMTLRLQDLDRQQMLASLAQSVCYEPQMAEQLGEIFNLIGEFGILDLRSSRSRETFSEYVAGSYWPGQILSRQFETNPALGRGELDDAAILITDIDLKDPADFLPIVRLAIHEAKVDALLIILRSLPDMAIHMLSNDKTRKVIHIVAAKTPFNSLTAQAAALQDLAMLTGGQPLLSQAGQSFQDARLEHFGYARRAWADKNNFGINHGKGDKRQLRAHIASLTRRYHNTRKFTDRTEFQERIGKLLGGSATLRIGGSTESELDARKELAKRTAQTLRGAALDGMLPGGGVALLACQPALRERLEQSTTSAERAAYHALLAATEAPIRTLLHNAGHETPKILGQIQRAGPGYGFDLKSERVVDMAESGVFDVATVQRDAVRSAISSAALALTIDTVVHHKNPEIETTP